MVKHWIFITSPENFEVCKKYEVYGTDERYETTVEKHLESGDMGLFYITKRQDFVGPWKIKRRGQHEPDHPAVKEWRPHDKYTYVIPIELKTQKCDLEKISDELLFITNRIEFSDHFQFSIISIRKEDYKTITTNVEQV